MSPLADGPIQFVGELDDTLKLDKITRFGRSFSIVRVPYAFKLLLQELTTLNINMRIITADNVDQLASMSFSAQISSFEQPKIKQISKLSTVFGRTISKSGTIYIKTISGLSLKEAELVEEPFLKSLEVFSCS